MTQAPSKIRYRTVKAGPATIFYREAGDPRHPALLLLHGFPTSSHMFRNLIPLLADRYHVVAPACRASASLWRPTGRSSPIASPISPR